MKRALWLLVFAVLVCVILFQPHEVQSKTLIGDYKSLTLAAVDATPLDGTTSGRQFIAADRVTTYSLSIDDRTDIVEVIGYSTGSHTANDTALINIYGYGKNGPALRVYDAATFTLGTAVEATPGLYADTISGTNYHPVTVNIEDSGNNTIAKMYIDTTGLRWLYFEPETFTGITNFIIQVREYGFK